MSHQLKQKKQEIKDILVAAYNAKASFHLHKLGLISYDQFCINYIMEFQQIQGFDLTNTIEWLKDSRQMAETEGDLFSEGFTDKENLFSEDYHVDIMKRYLHYEYKELEEYLDDTYELLFKL